MKYVLRTPFLNPSPIYLAQKVTGWNTTRADYYTTRLTYSISKAHIFNNKEAIEKIRAGHGLYGKRMYTDYLIIGITEEELFKAKLANK